MTQSELHAIMTAGFASVTADVFGLFVVYGVSQTIFNNAIVSFQTTWNLLSFDAFDLVDILCPHSDGSPNVSSSGASCL